MKKEKSCGVVVFYEDKVLIVKHKKGHYGLPKGHVENNETEEQTAIREVKEETNIDANIVEGFRKVITYSPKENVMKDVVFFVGTAASLNIKEQDAEVSNAAFYPIDNAENIITYNDERSALIDAIIFYKKLGDK